MVFLLGQIKWLFFGYGGHDWRCKDAFFFQKGNEFLRKIPLLLGRIKNLAAVLRSHIVPLSVQRSGIMRGKKDLQKFRVRNVGRIKSNLDGFGMARPTRTDFPIGRIFDVSTRVAGNYCCYTVESLKNSFGTPKTTASKNGGLD